MEEISPDILKLKSPANFVICGTTGSGKSMFVLKLLRAWPFENKLGTLVYMYSIWQPLFEVFMKEFPMIKFIQGISQKDIENRDTWINKEGYVNVCVCDDLVDSAINNETFARLFYVYGHHYKIINIFITQNMFFRGKVSTTINRNAHYFVLLKTPHLNTLDTLNHQLYGIKGPLKTAFLKSMELKQFNYILVDVFCENLKDRLRTCIFSDEGYMIIWRPLNS